MARTTERGSYRPILTTLLDGKDFQQLSAYARWVFVALKMRLGPTGIEVHYRDALAIEMAEQTGVSTDGIQRAFDELEAGEWVRFERNVVWIIRQLEFDPHMSVTDHKHRTAVQRHVAGLPHLSIVEAFEARYRDWFEVGEGPSEALPRPIEGPTEGLSRPLRAPKTEDGRPITDNGGQKRKVSATKKTALSDEWAPTDAHRQLAAEKAVDVEAEAEKMRDWSKAKGERRVDWDATFRNWLRKAGESGNGNGNHNRRKPVTGDYLAAVLLTAGSLVWRPETRDEALNRLAERYSEDEWDDLCPYFEDMPWHEVVPAQSDKFLLREVLTRHIERHDHAA